MNNAASPIEAMRMAFIRPPTGDASKENNRAMSGTNNDFFMVAISELNADRLTRSAAFFCETFDLMPFG